MPIETTLSWNTKLFQSQHVKHSCSERSKWKFTKRLNGFSAKKKIQKNIEKLNVVVQRIKTLKRISNVWSSYHSNERKHHNKKKQLNAETQ